MIEEAKFLFSPRQKKYQSLFEGSLWLTAKFLCGFNEQAVAEGKITYPMFDYLHGDFLNQVQLNKWRNLFVTMPRGFFKSSMMTIVFVIWCIINNPNIRIAICCSNMKLGKSFLRQLQNIVLSPLFKAIFPHLIPPYPPHSPKSDWSSTAFSVDHPPRGSKESTVTLLSPGSKTEGFHFDLIIGNDLVNNENYDSAVKRENVKNFWRNFTNLKDSKDTPVIIEGTFWHEDDLYNDLIINNPEYDVFYLPLYDNVGNCTFPEKFTPEYIAQIKNEIGDKLFATQYLLTPIATERTSFKGCQFIRYKEILDENNNVVKRVDELGTEYTSTLLGGMVAMDSAGYGEDLEGVGYMEKDTAGFYFQRTLQLMPRWYPSEKWKLLEDLDEQFDPDYFGIECEGILELDSVLPEEAVRGNSRIATKLHKLKSLGKSKYKRVNAAQPLLAQRRILYHESIPEKVIKDIQFFPEMKDDTAPDVQGLELQMFNELSYYAPGENRHRHIRGHLPRHLELFRGRAIEREKRYRRVSNYA